MPIIDPQVHAYERNHEGRPWADTLTGPLEVTGDDMVAAMDAVGVDGGLLVSPYTMYRYDASYAREVQAAHPGRFGLIKPFDPSDPGVAAEVESWAGSPGVVGARIMATGGDVENDAGYDRIISASARNGLPVNVLCWGNPAVLAAMAERHPEAWLVIDHLGMRQPFVPPPPPDPFAALDEVLSLARFDRVAIKISGACTLSRQPFPYEDLWDPLLRIIECFGVERCLWGSDWTRAVELLTYEQAVESFRQTTRLTEAERGALMGGSLERIYGWRPDEGG